MKDLISDQSFQSKVEFWAVTTIFAFAVLFLITGDGNHRMDAFNAAGVTFDYHENFFFPKLIQYIVLYLVILFVNFKVIPQLVLKERLFQNIVFLIIAFVLVGVVVGTTDTYLKEYLFPKYLTDDQAYNYIFLMSFRYAFWVLLMLSIYSFIKHFSFYLISHSEEIRQKYKLLTRDALAAFVVYMVSMYLLLIADADGEFILGWGVVAPFGILFYCVSFYYLIPKSLSSKRPFWSYVGKSFLLLLLCFFPIGLILILIINDEEDALGFSLFNSLFQLFITVPLSWVLYKRHLQGREEVNVLQTELGKSNANFDFLRSQINPHFLFNTLNTLYGTALQENSERTAQGIQMLGDMMRFMLHENHLHKILLSREIEYMRNYITLQSLRTSTSPNIEIQAKIEEVFTNKSIAPMLLIPFVENAFKHGISLKQKSWIKISLHTEQDKLYLDVYNSTHPKQSQDPEQDKSGVGLENVKQRLALLYPKRHELVIRETPEEFFVHLTVQLQAGAESKSSQV